jgi:LPXTG-motif cell wall-anchored protein
LPKTASELPLSALIGALSLVGALGLRAVRA